MTTTQQMTHWASRAARVAPAPRRLDLLEEALDGEVILVDSRSGDTHRLNETALAVWQACDGICSTREMAGQFVERYDLEFSEALDLVDQLVARFAEMQILDCKADS